MQKLPACGPVGWTIDGESAPVPVCTFGLILLPPAHATTNAPSTAVDVVAVDGGGGNNQGTGIDAELPGQTVHEEERAAQQAHNRVCTTPFSSTVDSV